MDIITYALLNKKIKNVTLAYTYKGSAASVSALPEDADTGDLFLVLGIYSPLPSPLGIPIHISHAFIWKT